MTHESRATQTAQKLHPATTYAADLTKQSQQAPAGRSRHRTQHTPKSLSTLSVNKTPRTNCTPPLGGVRGPSPHRGEVAHTREITPKAAHLPPSPPPLGGPHVAPVRRRRGSETWGAPRVIRTRTRKRIRRGLTTRGHALPIPVPTGVAGDAQRPCLWNGWNNGRAHPPFCLDRVRKQADVQEGLSCGQAGSQAVLGRLPSRPTAVRAW